jgi:protein-S-isoprenylcysteine O-methyltransferase Ste14
MNNLQENLWGYIYLLGWITIWVIRASYLQKSLQTTAVERKSQLKDQLLILILFLGTSVLPLITILTPWLDRFDFQNPPGVGLAATALLISGLLILRSAHRDLGNNYSQDLEIKQDHNLVTAGIYQRIRHPMYSSGFLVALAQIGLLQNWISSLAGILALGIFYILRVPEEESMLLEKFGVGYQEYMERTPSIIPGLGRTEKGKSTGE